MDTMLNGVVVGAASVVLGSVGFALSVLSTIFHYLVPPSLEDLPQPHVRKPISILKHSDAKWEQHSSVGSFISQGGATASSDASHNEPPTILRRNVSSTTEPSSAHRVTFDGNTVIVPSHAEPTTYAHLPRPSARSPSPPTAPTRATRVRSLSPIRTASAIENAAVVVDDTESQSNVASTSAVRLEHQVQPSGKLEPKRRGLLGLAPPRFDKRKKLARSVSTPIPPRLTNLPATPTHPWRPSSDGDRRQTLPPEELEPMILETLEESPAKKSKCRCVSPERCLKRKVSSSQKQLQPPARTNPYEAPYFFPQPGSPEAIDYVRKVREERAGGAKPSGAAASRPSPTRPSTEPSVPVEELKSDSRNPKSSSLKRLPSITETIGKNKVEVVKGPSSPREFLKKLGKSP